MGSPPLLRSSPLPISQTPNCGCGGNQRDQPSRVSPTPSESDLGCSCAVPGVNCHGSERLESPIPLQMRPSLAAASHGCISPCRTTTDGDSAPPHRAIEYMRSERRLPLARRASRMRLGEAHTLWSPGLCQRCSSLRTAPGTPAPTTATASSREAALVAAPREPSVRSAGVDDTVGLCAGRNRPRQCDTVKCTRIPSTYG
jgi:hypothetical protein